ncbi:GntR family transcriptional regulator [Mesorhizobium sp. 1B3]|uniref:GntR family transcriptional regulator n=1 Tax=Mesorhizobium sp. 1B3 TaxID=3243599 RepID=UPI003D99DA3A
MAFTTDTETDKSQSQTVRALLAIRELILEGLLAPGKRISELSVAERTGISRTPIRAALQRLETEGLVETIPSGGFAVKSFSQQDVFDAIEIRGALEGLAARLAAERGSAARLGPLQACLEELDVVVEQATTEEGFSAYVAANARFHALILDLAESPTLKRQMEKAVALPFASPSGFVMAQAVLPESHRILLVAQDQHRCVVEAIANREGARAQSIMQEHARLAGRNLRVALRHEKALERVPGGTLIRTVK